MHRSHRSTLSFCTVPLLVPLVILSGFVPATHAEAQKIKQAIAVAVVPFADNTGRNSEFIAQKATDAAALALEDSEEYVVAPRDDTQRSDSANASASRRSRTAQSTPWSLRRVRAAVTA